MSEKEGNLNIGFLGAGSRGIELLGEFDSLESCRIARVCDPNFSRLMHIQEWFPHIPVDAGDAAVLEDGGIDAVVVTAPEPVRRELVLAAMQAGKAVLVEAPMASNIEDANLLAAEASRLGVTLGVAHTDVFHPIAVEMKAFLDSGHLGELCYMESARMAARDPDSEFDVVWDLAREDVALALYLAGEAPVRVTAVGKNFVSHDDGYDVVFITVGYESGRFSQHHVSRLAPDLVQRFFVAGTKGAVAFNDSRGEDKLRIYDTAGVHDSASGRAILEVVYGLSDIVLPEIALDSPSLRCCAQFAAAVQDGRPVPVGAVLGRQIVQVLDAAEKSITQESESVRLS